MNGNNYPIIWSEDEDDVSQIIIVFNSCVAFLSLSLLKKIG